jgi:hypothetical protein
MALEKNIRIRIRLLEFGTSEPLSGPDYRLQLYDNDTFSDDLLGEGIPNEEGVVEIPFAEGKVASLDSPFETMPDLYFRLSQHGTEIYRSPIAENVNIPDRSGSFSVEDGFGYDLGTFLIRL